MPMARYGRTLPRIEIRDDDLFSPRSGDRRIGRIY